MQLIGVFEELAIARYQQFNRECQIFRTFGPSVINGNGEGTPGGTRPAISFGAYGFVGGEERFRNFADGQPRMLKRLGIVFASSNIPVEPTAGRCEVHI